MKTRRFDDKEDDLPTMKTRRFTEKKDDLPTKKTICRKRRRFADGETSALLLIEEAYAINGEDDLPRNPFTRTRGVSQKLLKRCLVSNGAS